MTWCESFGWFDAYDALEQTAIGVAIRESLWLFPSIEAVHLIGLAMLGGAVLIVDLRLLGVGLTRTSPARVQAAASRWFAGSLVVMVATGVPLFLSEAVKCCFNDSFEVKIAALLLGVAYTYLVRNPVARRATGVSAGEATASARQPPRWLLALTGAASIGVWFTVAGAGRWIGFSG